MPREIRVRQRTRLNDGPPATAGDGAAPAVATSSDGKGASDYEVGYKRPPKHTRFKPGWSGNPAGRSKGRKNFKTELLDEMHEQIIVREGGTRRTVSKQRAMLKSLTAKAMQGDTRAAAIIVNMVHRFVEQEDEPTEGRDLSAADTAILEEYEARIRRTPRVRHRSKPSNPAKLGKESDNVSQP